jgi:glycerol-3-phosphate O-acyltransferase / dihydroxyacetone phosphate acyltransferase
MYKLVKIVSDTEAVLGEDAGENSPLQEKRCQGVGNWVAYDVLGFVDQSKTFSAVHDALANGQCIGIFPEGGSHDNTDLLPLKVLETIVAFYYFIYLYHTVFET